MNSISSFVVDSSLISGFDGSSTNRLAEESLELGDASLHSQSHLKINAQPNSLKFQMASFEYRSQLLLENDEAIRANGFFQKSVKEHTLGGTICAFCYNTTLPWNVENADTQPCCCEDYNTFVKSLIEYNRNIAEMNQQIYANFRTLRFFNQKSKSKKQRAYIKPHPPPKLSIKKMDYMIGKVVDFTSKSKSNIFAKVATKQHMRQQQQRIRKLTNSQKKNAGKKGNKDDEKNSNFEQDQDAMGASLNDLEKSSVTTEKPRIAANRNQIRYSLSSIEYVDQGWTLVDNNALESVPSEHDSDDDESHMSTLGDDNSITWTNYRAEQLFQIRLDDQTGNVYYPSTRLAILLVQTSIGRSYMIFDDQSNAKLMAMFDAKGNIVCNHSNGNIRYQITHEGGIQYDESGAKCVKRWVWPEYNAKSTIFNPIIFNLNMFMSVRIKGRSRILLHFRSKYGSCQFKIDCRTKIAPLSNNAAYLTSSYVDLECHELKQKAMRLLHLIEATDWKHVASRTMSRERATRLGSKLTRSTNQKEDDSSRSSFKLPEIAKPDTAGQTKKVSSKSKLSMISSSDKAKSETSLSLAQLSLVNYHYADDEQ